MKIISYNVNGIRAAMRKDWIGWLRESDADIVCLQEIKATPDQLLDLLMVEQCGYEHYWYPAEKKGYSGTAILTKHSPKHVEYGFGEELYDREGRTIRADFEDFSVMSAYFPSGSSGDLRQEFKYRFLDDFQLYSNHLLTSIPKLVVSGDFNICHRPIDIHNPKANAKSSGFLPEEREWMQGFLDSGYIDSFRTLHPEPHRYSWWSYRANACVKNLGWRIDYHMVSQALKDRLIRSDIHEQAIHSDHCPVAVELDFNR